MLTSQNLWDLITATGRVLMPISDPNGQFFGPYDLEYLRMTSENNREPLPRPYELCVSFHIHPVNQTRVMIRKRSLQRQIVSFSACVNLKFERLH